jgi:hypothetical protein
MRFHPYAVFLGLLHAYVGLRLLAPLGLPAQLAGAALLAGCFALMPKGFRSREDGHPLAVLAPWIAMGFFSWLVVLTVLRDVSLLAVLALASAHTLQAWTEASAIAVIAATFAITLIGFGMARRVARVVHVDVPVKELHASLEGFTIAQISDLHVGATIRRPFVERIVERVNGLGADMVAITGDLVDGTVRELSHHTEPLGRLESRHGTYIVTGNHEYYSGAHAWIRELRRLGARVLLNEHVVLEHDGRRSPSRASPTGRHIISTPRIAATRARLPMGPRKT